MELVLIRGLPGSGKSTMAKTMLGHCHFEADQFFMRGGEYNFDPARLKDAHEFCQNGAELALQSRRDVVVSNTFTRKWEMQPYLDMAAKYGASVRIIIADGNYKNVHGVPDEAIKKMRDRWEN